MEVVESTRIGGAHRGLPMRKCPGVKTGTPSSGVESIASNGRLFRVASASVTGRWSILRRRDDGRQ